ncbi:hypothetical protein V6Z11_1Z142900 [Gossypium hirsutum]
MTHSGKVNFVLLSLFIKPTQSDSKTSLVQFFVCAKLMLSSNACSSAHSAWTFFSNTPARPPRTTHRGPSPQYRNTSSSQSCWRQN